LIEYEFTHVPFSISNSPAVFCRYVTATLRDFIQTQTIVVYRSKNEYEGLKALEKVLSVASRAGLQIKCKKAQFLKSKINFLGYTIENETIPPTNEKIKAVVNFPTPQSR